MAELANADIETLYYKCLIVHNGVLARVNHIDFDHQIPKFTLMNLSTQKKYVVDFRQEDFKNPEKRIGYVNIMQSVVYVVRLPVRKYHFGINSNNIEMRTPSVKYPQDKTRTLSKVKALEAQEIYNAYANKYPPLKEAIQNAKEWNGACAFDKQFCVDHLGKIFYKENCVGKVVDGTIKFNDGYEYLEIVLEDNYEKTSRTFRATPL